MSCMFHPEVELSSLSESSLHNVKSIDDLLKGVIPEGLHFEDQNDFLTWAEESFPVISSRHFSADSEVMLIQVFSWFSSEFCSEYYGALLKKRFNSQNTFSGMLVQHFDFKIDGIHHKRFCVMEIKIPTKEVDETYILSLKTLAKQTYSDIQPSKESQVLQRIESARRRFHEWLEGSVLEHQKCLFALAGKEFIEHRSSRLLSRLVISQYFIYKTLLKSVTQAPEVRHVICRLLPARLAFPFTSKTVLGVFVGISFLHKHELFSEEHLLRAIQKIIPECQRVSDSLYIFQRQNEPFKCIYLEITKTKNEFFSTLERQRLSQFLKEQVKWSVERLQPSIFVLNNEEETTKNILVLSQEISKVSDLPQVTIHFEEQTEKDVRFRIVVIQPFSKRKRSVEKYFQNSREALYAPIRTQIVRLLQQKYPVQAHVFHLSIPKSSNLLRSDASLNFYAARSRVSDLLELAIGPFRDFNGGIIIKQGENLDRFKRLYSEHPSDLIENFFYSLTPIEMQATIHIDTLVSLFELFLEGQKHATPLQTDYFVKHFSKESKTYSIFRSHDSSAWEYVLKAIKKSEGEYDSLTYFHLWDGESHFLGSVFESQESQKHEDFYNQLQKGISFWKSKLDSVKTLRLAMYSTPLSLDPRFGGVEDKSAILKMLFTGLTYTDPQGQIVLGVAKSVKISRNKKIYTFQLHSTFWSNGMPVTAHDFSYAWKTVLSPRFKTPFAYLFYPIKNAEAVKEGKISSNLLGVQAIDNYTLKVELNHPAPHFLELLSLPLFLPVNQTVDIMDPAWPTQQGEKFVCNGAFVLKTNHSLQGLELVKNPLYRNKADVQLDNVSIKKARIFEIQEMFLKDQIDWVGWPMGFINFPPLPRDVGEPVVLPNELLQWYVFNTQRFPFNNLKLRQAFSLVINRVRILQHIPPGSWPAHTVLPLHQTRVSPMEENREKGVRLFHEALQELGLDKETFPFFKLIYTEGGVRSAIAKVIQKEWEETLEVRCNIEAYEWQSLFSKITEGDFQIAVMDWTARIDDPSYTLEIFRKTNALINFPKWHHEEYEHLLDKASTHIDKQKRLDCYACAEKILLEEAAVLPILRTLPQSIKKSRMKMLHHASMKSWDFKWASIQTTQNKETQDD